MWLERLKQPTERHIRCHSLRLHHSPCQLFEACSLDDLPSMLQIQSRQRRSYCEARERVLDAIQPRSKRAKGEEIGADDLSTDGRSLISSGPAPQERNAVSARPWRILHARSFVKNSMSEYICCCHLLRGRFFFHCFLASFSVRLA